MKVGTFLAAKRSDYTETNMFPQLNSHLVRCPRVYLKKNLSDIGWF